TVNGDDTVSDGLCCYPAQRIGGGFFDCGNIFFISVKDNGYALLRSDPKIPYLLLKILFFVELNPLIFALPTVLSQMAG
uniref:hypothetical protein n=1 Tax=Endozoicomonas sp. YOMI1 TaxID=2828739 RepID=UPI002147FD83